MLTKDEILTKLQVRGKEQEELHKEAREVRGKMLSNKCSIRAVIEITNNCTVECKYCEMSSGNKELKRETLNPKQILEAIDNVKANGIKTIMLQGAENFSTTKLLSKVLPSINGGVEIILCLGNKNENEYNRFYKDGAKGYILKIETTNVNLHKELRGQSLYERIDCLNSLRKIGFNVGTGIISGLPKQSIEYIVDDLFFIGQQNWSMCSVSPFIPPTFGKYSVEPPADLEITLNIISILRMLQPTAMIPAVSALNMLDPDGQIKGLKAGANVITVNFTPNGFKENYKIYNKNRINFIVKPENAKKRIKDAEMEVSHTSTLGTMILSDEKELIKSFFNQKWKEKKSELHDSIYQFKNPLLEKFIETAISYNICDIGCGDGRYSIRFACKESKVTAIDFSKYALERLNKRAAFYKVTHYLNTIEQDARLLNLNEKKYDMVLMANILHYFSPLEIAGLLIKLNRILNENGQLYIGLETNIQMEYEKGKYFTFANQFNHGFDPLIELVKETGFQIASINETVHTRIKENFVLPLVVRKKLNTISKIYRRSFDLFEFQAIKV